MTAREGLEKAVGLASAQAVLRSAGCTVGARPMCVIIGGRRIAVGDRLRIFGRQFPASLGCGEHGRLEIGDDVFLNQGSNVYAALEVVIGSGTIVADLASISDTDFHPLQEGDEPRVAPVRLGEDVWVGRGATVLPGVSIGAHAMVAAGAVVTSDVPDRTVVAGVPARPVRRLAAADGWRRL